MKSLAIAVAGVAVVVIGWAAFRPELLFIDRRVSEAFPDGPGAPGAGSMDERDRRGTIVAGGAFRGVAHATRGEAAIHALRDGSRILRLTEFETSNGPDLRVLLVAADDAPDHDTVRTAGAGSGWVELGRLKGNIGDQNYEVPSSVDLDKYRTVTIWCHRFSVNFGSAPLRRSTGGA
ncbi:MAG TPA: DM13 domain-containing protein [Phycisphaerales bacterium]|nr:DM13 domain-containing protein [Phycisphaerales bacterium]HMP36029.1 DM13 domain-containing protein [Phycisphaerales bacterium]